MGRRRDQASGHDHRVRRSQRREQVTDHEHPDAQEQHVPPWDAQPENREQRRADGDTDGVGALEEPHRANGH